MVQLGAFGDRIGRHLGLEHPPTVLAKTLRKTPLAVTRLRSDRGLPERTRPVPRESAYLVTLQLREIPSHGLWIDGRPISVGYYPQGAVSVVNLEKDVSVSVPTPFDCLQFYVPRAALDEIADDYGAERVADLVWPYGEVDPQVGLLGSTLMPALARPGCTNPLFTDHLALALVAHFAHRYGGMRPRQPVARGGLAPWQVRRAQEILRANLDGEISLERLASECQLSRSHFARAFKQATGQPPHRWLMGLRIDKAKHLLIESDTPLADIALVCGFADQSHFSRAFAAFVGASPGAWRHLRQGGMTDTMPRVRINLRNELDHQSSMVA